MIDCTKPRAALVTPSRIYVVDGHPDTPDAERLSACVRDLAALGFVVVQDAGGWRCFRRYGGTDAERASELSRRLLDPEINLVIPVRGGYGMTRILGALDYEAIRRAKPLAMGFSDFTALNLALFSRAGVASWQGPVAGRLGSSRSAAALLSAIVERDWRLAWDAPAPADDFAVEGTLWGGNLSIIASLIGTPWFPEKEKIEGGILFLEDVNEPPYRIDRMLLQLEACGVLGAQSAVVFGDFSGSDDHLEGEGDLRLCDVLDDFSERLAARGVKAVSGLPFGHMDDMAAVPVGVRARLTVSGGAAVLSSTSVPVIRRGREVLRAALDAIVIRGGA